MWADISKWESAQALYIFVFFVNAIFIFILLKKWIVHRTGETLNCMHCTCNSCWHTTLLVPSVQTIVLANLQGPFFKCLFLEMSLSVSSMCHLILEAYVII